MDIREIERWYFKGLSRIIKSKDFINDLKDIEKFIVKEYDKLTKHWKVSNKLTLAVERLVRFHLLKSIPGVKLYVSPLASDVALILDDCILNVDVKTTRINGNKEDIGYVIPSRNQFNIKDIFLFKTNIIENINFKGFKYETVLEENFDDKPIINFFIEFIYYDNKDDISNKFKIQYYDLTNVPCNESFKIDFDNKIFQNFKTYKYGVTKRDEIPEDFIKFVVNNKNYYYDPNNDEVWTTKNKDKTPPFSQITGGDAIRIAKKLLEKRMSESGDWIGYEKIDL